MKQPPLIALVTDFGIDDPFVAEVKLAIWKISSHISILDVCHTIPPGDIERGAYVVGRVGRALPSGSVLLGIVDPGVGSQRQGVAIRCKGKFLVGPDNGLFSQTLDWEEGFQVRVLTGEEVDAPISATFHGRDLFAPVAARLAMGEGFEQVGKEGALKNTLPPPPLLFTEEAIIGRVVYIDRFGNIATNLPPQSRGELWGQGWGPVKRYLTYAFIPKGEVGWLEGSDGCIELAANRAPASHILNVKIGDEVRLKVKGGAEEDGGGIANHN